MAEYIAPKFKEDSFHCPHCKTYAHQKWDRIIMWSIHQKLKGVQFVPPPTHSVPKVNPPHGIAINRPSDITSDKQLEAHSSVCSKCNNYALWVGEDMVYPRMSSAPLPAEDMPEDVRDVFLEARKVVDDSPRAAESLLRLALEKLMPHLGVNGKKLDDAIKTLVGNGLPSGIQESLDSIRVIGNNAVHTGELVLDNDKETALILFKLMNLIVEKMITEKNELEDIYNKLPEGAKRSIKRRDGK
jgi:hypothetical protein